jgi:hypothetical protein
MTTKGQGVTVVVDPQKLAEVLRGPNGPVMRRMIEDGELVKREAQRLVGVYRPPDAYSAAHRKRRPGTLRDSIVKRVVQSGSGPVVQVGSDDDIALIHHEGTRPHPITPRTKPRLVFFWRKVGHVVSFKRVQHPGTQPNRFLTNALRVLRSRY